MKLFRVESSEHLLTIGSNIKSSGHYRKYLQEANDDKAKLLTIIEDSLDATNNIGGFIRRDCLFAFGELKDALIFSANIYRGNAQIYGVSASWGSILHKGDMNLLDLLAMSVENNNGEDCIKMLKVYCVKYWDKMSRTHSPCFEYLLKDANVEKLICTVKDCKRFYKEYKECQCGYLSLSTEQTNVYVSKINEVYGYTSL